jgi:putative transposase
MWRKQHKQLSGHYWKEHTLWSDGYFAASIGEVSAETIKRYIESQG